MLRYGMKLAAVTVFLVLGIGTHSIAQSQVPTATTVYGPETFKGSVKPSIYNRSFQSQPTRGGVLTIVSGSGQDIIFEQCVGQLPKKILCLAKNIVRKIELELSRPKYLEIKLNNSVLIAAPNYNPALGIQQVSFTTQAGTGSQSNSLRITIAGLPVSKVKLDAKVSAVIQNQPPIAAFVFNPTNSLAPANVGFSALLSSDPDGSIVNYQWDFGDPSSGALSFATGVLANHFYNRGGSYSVRLTVTDNFGATATIQKVITVTPDTMSPLLTVTPASGTVSENRVVNFTGSANEPIVSLTANSAEGSVQVSLSQDQLSFSGSFVADSRGSKTYLLRATDLAGNLGTLSVSYQFNVNAAPEARIAANKTQGAAPLAILFDASGSTDPDNDALTYAWNFGDGSIAQGKIATKIFEQPGQFLVTVVVTDPAGLSSQAQISINVGPEPRVPDPVTVAPSIADNSLDLYQDQIRFIYSGANPIQLAVEPGVLKENLVSLVKGRVTDESGLPIPGVRVSVPFREELGFTFTRGDGFYDLVVNGGSQSNFRYEKEGYLFSDRSYRIEQLRSRRLDDLILIKPDARVTKINLNQAEPQTVQSNIVTDADGPRKAAVIIPGTTQGFVVLPNGSRRGFDQLSLRVTEYTVGDKGPEKMPAPLPPSTNYTYAFDVSADEALVLGSKHIEFSKPVAFYVNNFLGFPVGTPAPYGIYDEVKAQWIGQPDGRVVKIQRIDSGRAVVKVSTVNEEATPAELLTLGIDNAELQQLAQAYPAGTELWRVVTNRFSPGDINWSGTNVENRLSAPPIRPVIENVDNKAPYICGSRIDINNLGVREDIDLVGVPFGLHYYTRREGAYTPNRTINFPITGVVVPQDLLYVDVEVQIAGQILTQRFPPGPNQVATFVWDGRDSFGRAVATSTAQVKSISGYRNQFLSPDLASAVSFGVPNLSLTQLNIPGRAPFEVTQAFPIRVEGAVSQAISRISIGGWSIDPVQYYDPVNKFLHFGNADQIEAQYTGLYVNTYSGIKNVLGFSADGTPAGAARLNQPGGLAIGPDGSVYFSDEGNFRLRKISTSGVVSTVLGTGQPGDSGDGGPAVSAQIRGLGRPAVAADGSIYVPDPISHKVRKISIDGIVSTFAGTGMPGLGADDVDPLTSELNQPAAVALRTDQSLLILESGNHRLRTVSPDGKIRTLAGTGVPGYNGSSLSAQASLLNTPTDLVVDSADRIFIADSGNRALRMVVQGQISLAAGRGAITPALRVARFVQAEELDFDIRYVDVNSVGEILVASGSLALKMNQSGEFSIYSGYGSEDPATNETNSNAGDQVNVGALAALYGSIKGILFLNDGSSLIADQSTHRIRRVNEGLPDFNLAGYNIASPDGSEIFQFSRSGRHLRTLFAKTGGVKWYFDYDTSGNLVRLTDFKNLTTQIERDNQGRPVRLTGPFGKVTTFAVNELGLLTEVRNANNESYIFNYLPNRLLSRFVKPTGATNIFEYDDQGQIIRDTSPENYVQEFLRTVQVGTDVSSTITSSRSAGGKLTSHSTFNYFDNEEYLSTVIFPDGEEKIIYVEPISGRQTTTTKTGSSYLDFYENPILGSLAKSPQLFYFNNRAGATVSQFSRIDLVRRSPASFFDYTSLEETYNFSDLTVPRARRTYDGSTRTVTDQSSQGRMTQTVLDLYEKPVQVQVANFVPISIAYDPQGRISRTTQGPRITSFSYGADGLLSSITDPLGQSTVFTRDAAGKVTTQTNSANQLTQFRYNPNGEVTGITPPGKLIHEFVLDLASQLNGYVFPAVGSQGNQQRFIRNADRDLVSEVRPDGTPISYSRNDKFLVTQISTPNEVIRLLPDHVNLKGRFEALSQNNQIRTVLDQPDGFMSRSEIGVTSLGGNLLESFQGSVAWVYRGINPVTENLNLSGNGTAFQTAIARTFDFDDLITGVGELSIARSPVSGLITQKALASITTDYQYSNFGEVSSSVSRFGGSVLFSEIYERDVVGRIARKTETADGQQKFLDYQYDFAGRLSRVFENGAQIAHYNYDLNGNRTSGTYRGQSINGIYDAQDRIQSYNNTDYTFNANGELVQKRDLANNVVHYSWNDFGQIKSVQVGTLQISYILDGLGRRIGKRGANERSWIYRNQHNIVAELGSDRKPRSYFLYGTKEHVPDYMVMIATNQKYKLIHDQLGSVRMVVNATTGVVAQQINYDEFGKVLLDTNPGFQPFGFAGGLYDSDTGLVRFGARDYDPEVGRWVSKDPILFDGGYNLYAYSDGDPVNKIDPNGRNPLLVIGFTALAGAIGNGLGAAYNGASGAEILSAVGHGAIAGSAAGVFALAGAGTFVAGGAALAADLAISFANSPGVLDPQGLRDFSNGINAINQSGNKTPENINSCK